MPRANRGRKGLYRRKDSSFWWGSYQDQAGRWVKKSTKTEDLQEAKQILAEWIARAGRLKPGAIRIRTFEELMLAYLDAGRTLKGRVKTPNSKSSDECCIAALATVFAEFVMLPYGMDASELQDDAIGGRAVYAYVEQRRSQGLSDASIRRELSVLGAAVTYANAHWGWSIQDPTRNRKPPQGEGRIRWISRDEATKLIEAVRKEPRAPYLADWIQAALYTGCRKQELLGLEWSRVDLQQRVMFLDAEHNKSRKRQSVPLNQLALEAFNSRAKFRAEHCPASPWVFSDKEGNRIANIKRAFSSACRRAGICDFKPHDCRHTLASWLVTDGVPLTTVKEVLRHSSIAVTERYAHLAPETARNALEALASTFLVRSSAEV